jgi:hypothetical protein
MLPRGYPDIARFRRGKVTQPSGPCRFPDDGLDAPAIGFRLNA